MGLPCGAVTLMFVTVNKTRIPYIVLGLYNFSPFYPKGVFLRSAPPPPPILECILDYHPKTERPRNKPPWFTRYAAEAEANEEVAKYDAKNPFHDFSLQEWRDSNPRHLVLETSALPAELHSFVLEPPTQIPVGYTMANTCEGQLG